MVLWVERAAQDRNNGPVPASSKWIAQEMSDGMDEVNQEFMVQYNHMVSRLQDMDLFISAVKESSANSVVMEELLGISPARSNHSQVLLSPNQTIVVGIENAKAEEEDTTILRNIDQQSPVLRNDQPNIAQLPSPITLHSTKTGPIDQSTENDITIKFDSPSILNPPLETGINNKLTLNDQSADERTLNKLDSPILNPPIKQELEANNKSSSTHQMLKTFEELRLQKFNTVSKIAKSEPVKSEPNILQQLEIADEDEDEANDSIQAIQIAIRKSIAEKRKSTQQRQSASRESFNIDKQLNHNNKVETFQPLVNSNKSSLVPSRPLLTSSLSNHELPKLPPAPSSIPTLSNNFRISSHYKTPKRKSSMFVGLPSREPIPISSARTNTNRPPHSVKSKQPKLTDKLESASQEDDRKQQLETASREDDRNLLISNTLSPVKLPRSLKSMNLAPPSTSESKLPTLSNYGLLKKPTRSPPPVPDEKETWFKQRHQESKVSPPLALKPIPSFEKDNSKNNETSIRHTKPIPLRSNSSNGSFKPYSANLSAPAKPDRSRSPERSSPIRKHQTVSHVKDAKPISRSRSPERSSPIWRSHNNTEVKSRSRTRSPEKHTSNISENYKTTNEPLPPVKLSGMDTPSLDGQGTIHDRYMLSTSSSVPKPKRTTNQPATKNKFLTTTLNRLSPVKTDDQSSIYGHRIIDSPIKNGSYNKNDLQIKRPLHSESIPSLKKSIGASIENSMKPKKIMLARRYEPKRQETSKHESPKRTTNLEVSSKESRSLREEKDDMRAYRAPTKLPSKHFQQTKVDIKKTEVPSLTRKNRRAVGNAVPLPDAARGITTGDKRRKLNNTNLTTSDSMAAKTPNKNGHTTPMKRPKNGDILPDILTDDEDNLTIELKKKRTIQPWAATPELVKYVTNQKNINPTDIFGEVNLQIDDVFASPTSKERGKQSPAISPINPDKMREQREYAIKMGYN